MEQLHFQSNLQVDFLEVGSLAIPPITVTFSIGPKEPLQFNLYCPTGEESREPSGCYSWQQKRNSLGVGFVGYGELWRTLSLIAFIMRCCNGVLGCMMGPNSLVISDDASVC